MKCIYLGQFPPPYGGVTVKNKLIFEELRKYIDITQSSFFNSSKNILVRSLSLISTILSRESFLILGLSKNSLIKITKILYVCNKSLMRRSIVMVMGGTFANAIQHDEYIQRCLKEYKHIYVEAYGMEKALNKVNILNTSVFPNCRKMYNKNIEQKITNDNGELKCLYFSLISKEKGADILVDSVKLLNKQNANIRFDFYGHIEDEYLSEFQNSVQGVRNINYNGVFKAKNSIELYEKLSEYDILIFPTRWKNEGVPGILVESKIAGLPAIVSNINYNSEIVEDGINGLVLTNNAPNELAEKIKDVYFDRKKLNLLKYNAKESSSKYFIENYLENLLQKLS
jgi:glycosyltransferase involved in cell wall biosynthesis